MAMQYDEKIGLLKSLPLLRRMPERQLASLAEVLKPRELAAGERLFAEGATGMSLYLVARGRMRISNTTRDLLILGPGDFFGEMALIDEVPRSASATAASACLLFELFRGDLSRWTTNNPQQAVQFFAELLVIESRRLRRASDEMTLHLDLSSLPPEADAAAFCAQIVDGVHRHLNGAWAVALYLAAESGDDKLLAAKGDHAFGQDASPMPVGAAAEWLSDSTLQAALPRREKILGQLLFHAKTPVPKGELDETKRTLIAVSKSVANALALRAR
jgi:CRP-like cAMP-binding protein